jgi:hypothetical protein
VFPANQVDEPSEHGQEAGERESGSRLDDSVIGPRIGRTAAETGLQKPCSTT